MPLAQRLNVALRVFLIAPVNKPLLSFYKSKIFLITYCDVIPSSTSASGVLYLPSIGLEN